MQCGDHIQLIVKIWNGYGALSCIIANGDENVVDNGLDFTEYEFNMAVLIPLNSTDQPEIQEIELVDFEISHSS